MRRILSMTRVTHRETNSILVPVVLECTTTLPALRRGQVRFRHAKVPPRYEIIKRTGSDPVATDFAVNRLRAGPGSRRTVYRFLLLIGCEKHCGDSVCRAACDSKEKF